VNASVEERPAQIEDLCTMGRKKIFAGLFVSIAKKCSADRAGSESLASETLLEATRLTL
jgi:hypothetical protein